MVWVERVEIHSAAVLPVLTFLAMAATELLDYNQIQEQSSSTGDKPEISGGLLTWNFRCDPNLAWDPSQSWFAMDVELKVRNYTNTVTSNYIPEANDLRPFFPLRMFSSMTHIIDGVTVAHTNQPYADKLIQERYLKENTQSNLSNFEAASTVRMIDGNDPALHPWASNAPFYIGAASGELQPLTQGVYIRRLVDPIYESSSTLSDTNGIPIRAPSATHTILFQPPFDFWTKHQRCSGGNHQIQLVMKPGDSILGWGEYVLTPCFDLATRLQYKGIPKAAPSTLGGSFQTAALIGPPDAVASANYLKHKLIANVPRLRLMRRMVRFTVERPLSVQEFNLTEMQFYHGTASPTGVTQNFLLPSSTFGLVFYWRQSTNSEYDCVGDFPDVSIQNGLAANQNITASTVSVNSDNTDFFLDQFYFTYGGETYPSQRVDKIGIGTQSEIPAGYEKLQTISHQLQGVYNMPQENMNMQFGAGQSLLTRLNDKMFFFPVAKHNNSDNSDLQVTWSHSGSSTLAAGQQRSLVVVALYDARVELAYNAANQLERVTKTEWK